MTDLDQLLARIAATLAECDASKHPDLRWCSAHGGHPVGSCSQCTPRTPSPYLAPTTPHNEDQALIEASPKRRSWLVRWLARRAQP